MMRPAGLGCRRARSGHYRGWPGRPSSKRDELGYGMERTCQLTPFSLQLIANGSPGPWPISRGTA